MRANVRCPNIILRIHPHRVGGSEEIIRDTASEFPGGIKLHQRMLSAMKHIDMSLGIYRHTGDFDEMLARR